MTNETWQQDVFDESEHQQWSDESKEYGRRSAKCRVVSVINGHSLCIAGSPEQAAWIAERLNLAARLENANT